MRRRDGGDDGTDLLAAQAMINESTAEGQAAMSDAIF